jgi:hypothetical protein
MLIHQATPRQPGFRILIARSLPGSMTDLVRKSGCAESTIRRWLHRMRADGTCHISGWERNCSSITAIYSAGPGPDAPCRLKRKTSAQYSKEWRDRARKSGELDVIYARKNARDRASTATKKPHDWAAALFVGRRVEQGKVAPHG